MKIYCQQTGPDGILLAVAKSKAAAREMMSNCPGYDKRQPITESEIVEGLLEQIGYIK